MTSDRNPYTNDDTLARVWEEGRSVARADQYEQQDYFVPQLKVVHGIPDGDRPLHVSEQYVIEQVWATGKWDVGGAYTQPRHDYDDALNKARVMAGTVRQVRVVQRVQTNARLILAEWKDGFIRHIRED